MTISIGDFTLRNGVALAPMSGVSDTPFRRAAHRAGAGLVVSEMVASRELANARPDVLRRAEGDPSVRPFVIQLAGCDPDWMAEGARLAEAAGADIVDINMGCPSRQVTGVQSGSALMRQPDLARAIIHATVAATRLPVTLKMRLGWDLDSLNAPDLARMAQDAGIRMITVHGRTRCQFYTGRADWSLVAETRAATDLPLIVNGDIDDVAAARDALAQSGGDGVMIGRAAIGRAWLPGAIAEALETGAPCAVPPPLAERLAQFLTHYRDTIDHYGPARNGPPLGVRMARKHLAAFIDTLPAPDFPGDDSERRAFRAQICRENDPHAVEQLLRDWLSPVLPMAVGASRSAA